MANNYNSIAKYYDALSRLVYQRAIIDAQVFLAEFIKDDDNILLVGGGTGWILEELSKLHRRNIRVVYVEKSEMMMRRARQRKAPHVQTTFVLQPVEYYLATEQFDVVLTPFVLDNFKREKINILFPKLDALLKQHGIWLYADFVHNSGQSKWWQRMMLKNMYRFFRYTAHIEADELVDMQPYFAPNYQLVTEQLYYRRFIRAQAYLKRR